MPSALHSQEQQLHGRSQYAACRRKLSVVFVANEEDRERGEEEDGGDEVCKVETDVSLCINHGDLANQGPDVDEPVEKLSKRYSYLICRLY